MDSRNCDVTTGYFRVKCVPSSGTLRIYVRVSDERAFLIIGIILQVFAGVYKISVFVRTNHLLKNFPSVLRFCFCPGGRGTGMTEWPTSRFAPV